MSSSNMSVKPTKMKRKGINNWKIKASELKECLWISIGRYQCNYLREKHKGDRPHVWLPSCSRHWERGRMKSIRTGAATNDSCDASGRIYMHPCDTMMYSMFTIMYTNTTSYESRTFFMPFSPHDLITIGEQHVCIFIASAVKKKSLCKRLCSSRQPEDICSDVYSHVYNMD